MVIETTLAIIFHLYIVYCCYFSSIIFMRLFLLLILIANLSSAQLMQFDLNTGQIVPLGYSVQRMLKQVINVCDPNTSTAECTFSRDDTKRVLGILNDARSYLEGVMALLPESVSNREIAHQELRSSKQPFCVPYEMRVKVLELTIAFSIKRFRDNLDFLANTVSYSLDSRDKQLRDTAYRQLIREIRSVNHWFSSDGQEMTNNLTSLSGINFMKTMQEIFSDLRTYFPSCDLMLTQNMFTLTNGVTRIDQMDEVNNGIWNAFDVSEIQALIKIRPKKALKPWRIAALNEWKSREILRLYEETLADMRQFVYGETHPKIKPLLRAIGAQEDREKARSVPHTLDNPEEWLGENFMAEHAKFMLQRKQQNFSRKKKPQKQHGHRQLETPTCADLQVKQEMIELEDSESTLIEHPFLMDGVGTELCGTTEAYNTDDEVLFPKELHERHQQRKQMEKAAAALPEVLDSAMATSNCYITPEMSDFLSQSVYVGEQSRCSWRDFETAVSRNGFRVDTTQKGNVRRVVHIQSGKRFTVHRPNDETATLLHEYTSFIRSGFERVFEFNPYY